MAEPESHTSRAEQRATAVAKLKRAASLPRMKDGRRPPMHSEGVSESENPVPTATPTPPLNGGEDKATPEPPVVSLLQHEQHSNETPSLTNPTVPGETRPVKEDSGQQQLDMRGTEPETEGDGELEERSFSPGPSKRRRPRSRSRSRNSKDFKGKNRGAPSPSPIPHIAGDSSPDEAPPMPIALPIIPPLFTPVPSPFGLPQRFMASPDPSMFFAGPSSPPTPLPLPSLEALQKGLMRSNSARSTADSRRQAMAKLMGEPYDPSPSPPPLPPSNKGLTRNNTVAGGERIAARELMLGRLGARLAEVQQETDSDKEERAPTPVTSKRRKRRSRRGSASAALNGGASDTTSTNPPTPLPTAPNFISANHLLLLRSLSTTPNQAFALQNQSDERLMGYGAQANIDSEDPEHRHRGVLVEDEDDDDNDGRLQQETHPVSRPRTPAATLSPHQPSPRLPMFRTVVQNTDSPASHSSDSIPAMNGKGSTVPLFLGRGSPARFDRFPSSPFTTPLKEKQPPLSDEEDEVVLRPRTPAMPDSRPRTPYANNRDAYDREISWVAYPAHKELPVNENEDADDYEEEEEEDGRETGAEVHVQDDSEQYQDDDPPLSPTSDGNALSQSEMYDTTSRVSVSSTSVVVESEVSTDIRNSAPSPFQAIPLSQSGSQQNGERLVVSGEDWEERLLTRQISKKGSAEAEGSSSQSTWERLKNSISRSTSSAGRRSRSNSIINRERNSSISRESGASLTSGGKGDRTSFTASSQQQSSQHPVAPPLMQSPSASASISSLAPPLHMRGNPSPIPPASDADRMKYQNDKLFPFPGMKRLEEQRRDRTKGAFPDTPGTGDDLPAPLSAQSFSQPQTPDIRDSSPKREYIDLVPLNVSTSSSSSRNKLPMSFTDVRQWLSKNKNKKGSSSAVPAPTSVAMSPSLDSQFSTESGRPLKTALSDLMQSNAGDSDWEGRTPTASKPSAGPGQPVPIQDLRNNGRQTPATNGTHTDTERTPKAKKILPLNITSSSDSRYQVYQDTPIESAKPDRYMSPTPDPTSSLSEFPAQTTSESSSSSEYSSLGPTAQAMALLRRLDDTLSRGPVPVEESPRKLLFSSPVLQVVNPNTVKDRFLFLFSDILVVAKPIIQDTGTLMDSSSIIPTDRRYIVKSVARFRDMRFCPDRTEAQPKSPGPSVVSQSPLLQAFVSEFTTNPDQAIKTLVSAANIQNDAAVVGQLLFKAHELKRQPLGEYLARRSSKHILKAFLDNFGFAGLRIDIALRIFLHSIHIPQTSGVLEYFLDSFASRWYEANAKSVAYDRDMAVRLVRAVGQLNELLHGEITAEAGPTGPVRRNIALRDFLDAFRRYDLRRLVSDELLDEVYASIRDERLSQGRAWAPASNQDIVVTFKRPLPTRLTYKIQSDPVIVRLPRADPSVTFYLYGQDLVFEPPMLSFVKSPEASFRVTGTALGPKSIVILRSGSNAVQYQGIPLSYPIPVERAFMRNTFQIAFLNHKKLKRRYMFSVDDHLLRHQWVQSIRQQIGKSLASPQLGTENPIPGASEFYQAADDVAFTVLQETLIEGAPRSTLPSNGSNGHTPGYLSSPDHHLSVSQSSPSHRRSKSRSKLYGRQGAGRLEFDLSSNHHYNTSQDSSDAYDSEFSKPVVGEASGTRSWTGREIELHCQQNSLIPAVLSYLQSTGGTPH